MFAEVRKLLNTAEAAEYLRFRSTSGIRNAVARKQLRPVGAGAKRSHLFTVEELHRFISERAARYALKRSGMPGRNGTADERSR